MSCASFLAICILLQLSEYENRTYPRTTCVITHAAYIYDVITGYNSIKDAVALKDKIAKVLKAGIRCPKMGR